MKTLFWTSLLLIPQLAMATPFGLNEGLFEPESVYYEPTQNVLYVSNVAGKEPGWIGKVSTEGKAINEKWFTGLNDPRGMRSFNGVLYVTDNTRVVGMSLDTGVQVSEVLIPDAKFLNDIAISSDGVLYVSDTIGNRIYEIKRGRAAIFAQGPELQAPNGLAVSVEGLVVASWGYGLKADWSSEKPGSLYKIDWRSKDIVTIASEIGHLDGLEFVHGHWIVSDWIAGKVFAVDKDGKIIEGVSGFKGAADIGLIPARGNQKALVVVPSMLENKIVGMGIEDWFDVSAFAAGNPVR